MKIDIYEISNNEKTGNAKIATVDILSLPSPSHAKGINTDVVSLNSLGKLSVLSIVYKPDIKEWAICFDSKYSRESKKLFAGIVDKESPLTKIHFYAKTGRFPVINEHDVFFDLPRIPSTTSEFICVYGSVYRIVETVYSDFKNQVSCGVEEYNGGESELLDIILKTASK